MKPPKGAVLAARADARALPLADNSVDLVVTSPPYFALRDYGGHNAELGTEATAAEYVEALIECTVEMVRVLKPAGSLFVNLGDKYAGSGGHNQSNFVAPDADPRGDNRRRRAPSVYQRGGQDRSIRAKSLMGLPWRYALACVDKLDLIWRAEIIWSKTCALPESVDDRVRRTHEVFLHFTTQERYYCDTAALRQPYASSSKARDRYAYPSAISPGRNGTHAPDDAARAKMTQPYAGTRQDGTIPPSVWEAPTAKRPPAAAMPDDLADAWNHAAFPTDLPERIIAGWCPPGGLVLDPFGGNGTTAAVARALGRNAVTLDLSASSTRLSRWRAMQSGTVELLRGERPPVKTMSGQGNLLDLLETT